MYIDDELKQNILDEAPREEPARQYYFINECKKIAEDIAKKKGNSLTCCINTFGCQMNAHDSEKLLGIMKQIGYEETDSENADFVLYNTCTVRENANMRIYGRLGVLSGIKKNNPNMIIAMCGCMMQEDEVVEKIRKSYKFVDIIFGTHNVYKLAELLFLHYCEGKNQTEILSGTSSIVENLPSVRKYSFKCGVNIMYGCNNFCTYCIVPYVRGRERSRKKEDILAEIQHLADDGVVEIMLLGQNVNSYQYDFPDLLLRASEVKGIERVRFMTSHPKDLSDDLIKVVAENPKIARHIHLPLQSGSTQLLKKMNRHYTKESYIDLAQRIREAIPDIAITTDIIVGFPGETEKDFEETLDVVDKVSFDSAFTFIYSKRTGTPAAAMDLQVPKEVSAERMDRLLTLCHEKAQIQTAKNTGKIMRVLAEGLNDKDPGLVTGRLSNNSVVHFEGCAEMIGHMFDVRLDSAKVFYYIGSLV